MKRIIYLFVFFISIHFIGAQATYKNFNSARLGEARDIKIQLPRSYDKGDKSYPIILVLDGDYMFEIVSGNVDYASYWEDIPEAIVVGVNQYGKRDADNLYSEQNSLPIETGAAFFEFISMELIPFIEKTYRTEKFKVAIGHGTTANFINYYLLKENPLFNAYVAISPDLAADMTTFLTEKLPKIENKTFYYLATSDNDVKSIQKGTKALNDAIKGVDNKNVLSSFNDFIGPSHYALPAHAIPQALEDIFFVFRPISKKEYKESILKLEDSPVDYLVEKYRMIEDLFGIKKPILVNDFRAIAAAIKKTEKFEYFEPLGKLARKEYPDTLLGNYYLGRFYEETGKPKKAMKTYQSAYILEEIGGITKDHVLELSEQIKADFGY
ncbi:alpha/beta hydrolase-fold protein [uncultured Lacinutrix sp.]|uniref:alpha/beta hydrolase n=1 Tax=uncultured Lacinutrix sp. TaxID=574032 RepID=UPI00262573FD|nr:alpha/beta hydrolase-fold protein [uncultured Lacinutrix sp.]